MSSFHLIKNDIKFLRLISKKITSVNEGRRLANKLISFLKRHNEVFTSNRGIGLAAPQMGIYKQVAVVLAEPYPLVLINPKIEVKSPLQLTCQEGCLSFPGIILKTKRHFWIKISSDSHKELLTLGVHEDNINYGKNFDKQLLYCVATQHEIGHISNPVELFFDVQDTTNQEV